MAEHDRGLIAERPRRILATALLWAAAAGWFSLGCTTTLEWTDEGGLVYTSWRFAEGALPYRDLHHNYGPSVFVLNGALFRLFGADLLPIRLSLVAVKAALAVIILLLARQLAGIGAGLAAYVLFLGVWGLPVWFLNAPYAAIYQNTLCLAGVLVYLGLDGRPRARGLLSGVCFGLATTFKQTGGALCFTAFVLALFARDAAHGRPGATDNVGPVTPRWLGPLMVIAAVLLYVGYSVRFGDPRDAVLLVGPAVVGVSWLGTRTRGHSLSLGGSAWVWAIAGFLLPLLGYLAVYLALGAAGGLVHDTLLGLPGMVRWLVPFPRFDQPTAVVMGVLAAAFLLVGLAVAVERGRWRGAVALLVIALMAGAAAQARINPGEIFRLLVWLPPLTAWGSIVVLLARRPPAASALVPSAAVVWGALVGLQPAADLPHVLLALPMFLPLAAAGLSPLRRASERLAGGRPAGGRVAVAMVVALAATLVTPLARSLLAAREASARGPTLERARGIRPTDRKARDAQAVLAELRALGVAERGLLVLPTEPMFYYLAGQRSVLEPDEFALYLAATGIISNADARTLVDEARAVATLETRRPLVVRAGPPEFWSGLERAFPAIAHALRTRYRERGRFGSYSVLEHVDGAAG